MNICFFHPKKDRLEPASPL